MWTHHKHYVVPSKSPFHARQAVQLPKPVLCAVKQQAAVGIDLGTTNSVVAVLKAGETCPTVLIDSTTGSFTVPSVVSYDPATGTALVGAAAKQQAAAHPHNTFYSVKRLMGRSWSEIQELGLLYQVAESQDGRVELVCPATATHLLPEQVRLTVVMYQSLQDSPKPDVAAH